MILLKRCLFLMFFALPLMGCGKKGSLEAPPTKDPLYPRTYPIAHE